MSKKKITITSEDIVRLQTERSPEARAGLIEKIAESYTDGLLNERETALANEIFRILMNDAETLVRRTLSESMKQSADLPHDIAMKLARDIEDVATPILEHSMALMEDDLIEIVRSTGLVAILTSVAKRKSVSADLSHALLQKREHEVFSALFANRGATIRESDIDMVLQDIKGDDSLLNTLIQRGDLSLRLVEKMFVMASDDVKKVLTGKYHLTQHVAEESAAEVLEMITLGMADQSTHAKSLESLVDELYEQERLSFSMVVRALCLGKLSFFENAMAKLAGIPLLHAKILILDPGAHGFRSLYDKTDLPQGFYPAVKALLEVTMEETQQGRYRMQDLPQRMIERINAKGYDEEIEHLDFITAAIGRALHDNSNLQSKQH